MKKFNLDKVIFVPVGDKYNKPNLISEEHRLNMLKLAVDEHKELEVSEIELNRAKNLTTLEAFKKIEKSYKDVDKFYIIGADNLTKILSSVDADELINNYRYIVIKRGEISLDKIFFENKNLDKHNDNFFIMENTNHTETSATKVRNNIEENVKYIDEKVYNYIKKNNLYK